MAIFVPLAIESKNDVASWDYRLSQAIHAYENRETVLDRWINPLDVVLGAGVQILGLVVVAGVVLILAARGRPRLALFVVAGVLGATILGPLLKEVIARPPVDASGHNDGYAFPSGHALRSLAAAGALAVVAWSSKWRWPLAAGFAVAVATIGIALVYHEWHLISDVLAGWCVGIAWLGSAWLLLRPRDPERQSHEGVLAGALRHGTNQQSAQSR